jgi:DNA-binding MarR family transcriptional regulator
MTKTGDMDLANYLPYLVNRVGVALVANFTAHALAQETLTIAMWRVLAALSYKGAQRQVDLSVITSIDVSTLSRIVAQLTRRGLVSRARSVSNNREVTVALTAKGRALVRRLVPVARALERKATKALPVRDHAALRRILRAVYANLTEAQKPII